jgi:hypothetical protein
MLLNLPTMCMTESQEERFFSHLREIILHCNKNQIVIVSSYRQSSARFADNVIYIDEDGSLVK